MNSWLVGAGVAFMFWWGLRGSRGALSAPLELDDEDYELLAGRQDDFERRWQLMMQHLRRAGRLPSTRAVKVKPAKTPRKKRTPEERKEREREYQRNYRKSAKFKEWLKAYTKTEKFKKYQREYKRAFTKTEKYKLQQAAKGKGVRQYTMTPEERRIKERDSAREQAMKKWAQEEVRFPGDTHTDEQKVAYIERLKKRRERIRKKWEQQRGRS